MLPGLEYVFTQEILKYYKVMLELFMVPKMYISYTLEI